MHNKNLMNASAFVLLFISVALSAFIQQQDTNAHIFFHLFAVVVALLFVHMEGKYILLTLMMGFFSILAIQFMVISDGEKTVTMNEILALMAPLGAEAFVILLTAVALDWYAGEFRQGKAKQTHVLAYQKQCVEDERKAVSAMNAENARLLDEIKNLRRELQD